MDRETEALIEAASADAWAAAHVNQRFVAMIVSRLVELKVLEAIDVYNALFAEQEFIEDLRRQKEPGAVLAAISLERLAGLLAHRILGHGRTAGLLGEWLLDPSDPLFPDVPAND